MFQTIEQELIRTAVVLTIFIVIRIVLKLSIKK